MIDLVKPVDELSQGSRSRGMWDGCRDEGKRERDKWRENVNAGREV